MKLYFQGTRKVLGISLDIDEIDELHVHERAFEGMRNLRFLKIFTNQWMSREEVRLYLPEDFNYLPPKLRLLSWYKYPLRFMPSNFRPENLVKLKMSESKLEKLWEGVRVCVGNLCYIISVVLCNLKFSLLCTDAYMSQGYGFVEI